MLLFIGLNLLKTPKYFKLKLCVFKCPKFPEKLGSFSTSGTQHSLKFLIIF